MTRPANRAIAASPVWIYFRRRKRRAQDAALPG